MAASWDAVQMMLGKIWTRLEVIDKLAEAQGKLCQRLDELEKALGRLDPKASAVINVPRTVAEPSAIAKQPKVAKPPIVAGPPSGEAKTPALTAVYDPINKAVKLVTMAQYERHYPKIPAPTYVAVYCPEKQSVELMFEKHYLESAEYAKILKASPPSSAPKKLAPIAKKNELEKKSLGKPKPVPEYTMVYDPDTQEAKLQLWTKYVQKNNPPTASFGMKYNAKKQGIDLVFWRNYQPGGGYKVLSVGDFF
jgi:hypothetical protein